MKVKWSELTEAERNAIVLENVFGWIKQPTSCRCGASIAWMKPRPTGGWEMAGCVCHHTPNVSTDSSAALEVIEKMRTHYQITISTVERPTDKYSCGFRYRMDDETEYTSAPTAPEAICIAALRACRVEVEQ